VVLERCEQNSSCRGCESSGSETVGFESEIETERAKLNEHSLHVSLYRSNLASSASLRPHLHKMNAEDDCGA
jgi:hypothetical protein